ncbi:PLP-dependent aminotransferase family protein [Rhodovibrio salinarum]|uniref:PLP-dependent aminotransferase family protein n=1 Tax=Rhodovibrio salinarum TaxID=1087 RepID=A0A934UZU3_9PROT|nr:PLP-dependent aminotransferase family protein [Rhodovibrio salinarum]MBK1697108.1 PLP-dependent aminotransferase family protein [Rhodovibrio salinarum]
MARITLELPETKGKPVFLTLAESILLEIERGRLKPGDRLPGTRGLAETLQINRNTVDAAYQELIMQGWLASVPSRGTFVARDLPDSPPKADPQRSPQISQPVADTPVAREPRLQFSDGTPDPRLLPGLELSRAFRRALSTPLSLAPGYGDPRGSHAVRSALGRYLTAERGLTTTEDDILVTNGSQMALFVAARTVLSPGQVIAVEDPGYPLAWSAFREAGAKIVGIPVDANGLDVTRLAAVAETEPRLKAIYVTPHHQYPTTVTLGAGRRLKLLDLAARYGLTLIEDDYDHEYRFESRPVLPLAARAEVDVSTVYIGSLSKLLSPGLRVGYAVAPPPLLQEMARRREAIDRQGNQPLEQAIAQLIDDGTLGRHARKARRIYRARRDLLIAAITDKLGNAGTCTAPAGGLAAWFQAKDEVDTGAWVENAAQKGLSIMPGGRFSLTPNRAQQGLRIGYASLNENELRHAIGLLAQAKA